MKTYFECFFKDLASLMNALVYIDIDLGIHQVKYKVARIEKQKKNYMGLFIHKIQQILKRFSGALS